MERRRRNPWRNQPIVKTIKLSLLAGVLSVLVHAQAPTVTSVNNAASYGTAIAQGSIFVVFGTAMGPAQLVQASSLPLATTLNGTSIRFTPVSGGAAVDAYPVYTSAAQLAGVLPSTAAQGEYNVTVTYNGATSAPLRARVVARGFGMVTLNGRGNGLAVMQNASDSSSIVQFGAPARPGQVMVLYGTGLGPIRIADNVPPGAQDLRGDVDIRVVIGNVEVTPDYAGRSSSPGLDQINFTVPASAPQGCSVPLAIRVGSGVSPAGSIAIAPAGRAVCEHPFLTAEALRRLDARGSLVYGAFSLSSFGINISVPSPFPGVPAINLNVNSEAAAGAFYPLSLANLTETEDQLAVQPGTCTVTRGRVDSSGAVVGPPVTALDAGTLTLNGPGVANRALTKTPQNSYALQISNPAAALTGGGGARVIAPGTYTLAGTGGSAVGSFTANLQVGQPVTWTNRTQITQVVRSQPLTINWSGGTSDDLVSIVGAAGTLAAGTQDQYDGATFICTARATAGTFTVPPSILQQMPAAEGLTLSGLTPNTNSIAVLIVNASSTNPANGRFSAPLVGGGTVEFGLFTYSFGAGSFVPYR